MQEAYLAAHVRLADFRDLGDGSFGRWLGQILEHKIRDALRRQLGTSKRDVRQEVSQGGLAAPQDAVARDPSPSQVGIRREERARLDRAVEGLSRTTSA